MCSRWKTLLTVFIFYYKCAGEVPAGSASQYEVPFRRFEYKYSFKGPYLAQKDNTIPFWEYHGSAIASDQMVRITPSLTSQKGVVWNKEKTTFDAWEVEMWFRISGKGRLGADGIAFWYTEEKGLDGKAFGAPERWKGLGIFFDSYPNDGQRNDGSYVMAMVNDGTKVYDHENDGRETRLAECSRNLRNKPYPLRAKIEYYANTLSLLIHTGDNSIDDRYELCFRREHVYLPQYGYFGVSAATGGLADDHDVLKFLTSSLTTKKQVPGGIAETEKDKFTKEYQDYKTKLEKQQEEYFKSHPEEERKFRERESMSPEREYDSVEQRALHQIFTGQSQIAGDLVALSRKLDELLGRQERALSMLSNMQYGVGAPQPGVPGGAPVPMPIQRHEVEALLANQQEVVKNVREMKAGGLQPNQPASVQASAFHQQLLTEVRDSVNVLRKDLNEINIRLQHKTGAQPSVSCPTVSCLSSTHFFVFMIIHLAILLGFAIYKSNKESQAKKFY